MQKKMINEAMRIAGKKVTFEKTIDVEYPFTGEVIGTVPAGNAEHARQALEIAANYQPKLTRYERQKILQKDFWLLEDYYNLIKKISINQEKSKQLPLFDFSQLYVQSNKPIETKVVKKQNEFKNLMFLLKNSS